MLLKHGILVKYLEKSEKLLKVWQKMELNL